MRWPEILPTPTTSQYLEVSRYIRVGQVLFGYMYEFERRLTFSSFSIISISINFAKFEVKFNKCLYYNVYLYIFVWQDLGRELWYSFERFAWSSVGDQNKYRRELWHFNYNYWPVRYAGSRLWTILDRVSYIHRKIWRAVLCVRWSGIFQVE